MESVLIVCNDEKYTSYFKFLLGSLNITNIVNLKTAKECRDIINNNHFDLVIINSPLIDEFGKNLAIETKDKTTSEVIITLDNESFEKLNIDLIKNNIHCISKPFNRKIILEKLQTLCISISTIKRLSLENKDLKFKIEEIKKIDRAKCLLISYLGMNEKQAHKYIEKQSMDFRVTKTEIAEKILKTYVG